MSRFANPKATGRFVLPGPCACPGQPHDEDWMDLRTELGTADIIAMLGTSAVEDLALLTVGWNLLDDDGSPAPVDREHIDRLYGDEAFFNAFREWSGKHIRNKPLPNGSSVPSRNGSRGNAGSLQTIPTRR